MTEEFILIVNHESDTIHFHVLDAIFLPQIEQWIEEVLNDFKYTDELLSVIYDNELVTLSCQSYVTEVFKNITNYNITKCIHLPELSI